MSNYTSSQVDIISYLKKNIYANKVNDFKYSLFIASSIRRKCLEGSMN